MSDDASFKLEKLLNKCFPRKSRQITFLSVKNEIYLVRYNWVWNVIKIIPNFISDFSVGFYLSLSGQYSDYKNSRSLFIFIVLLLIFIFIFYLNIVTYAPDRNAIMRLFFLTDFLIFILFCFINFLFLSFQCPFFCYGSDCGEFLI